MRRRPIVALGPQRPDLEALIIGLHVAVRLQDPTLPDWPIDTWARDSAAGVGLGRILHSTGLLQQLCTSRAETKTMVDALTDILMKQNNVLK